MNILLLKVIALLHIFVILFTLGIPLTNSNYFLLLHAIFVPFLMVHWICGDKTCILTITERKLRKFFYGKFSEDNCITCKIVEPVYEFKSKHNSISSIVYSIVILTWVVSVGKLICGYTSGNITGFRDLFKI